MGARNKNRVRVSKLKQYEAFPETNFVDCGTTNARVYKVVPCKDSLMVFKEDGLFRVTASGAYGEVLSAELVDPNAILWAKDTAVAINGVIMAWLTKGVAIINEQGVEKYVSSQRIEDRLAPPTTKIAEPDLLHYPWTQRAQAFVDEKNNLYELRICFTFSPSAPYASTKNFIYNAHNDTWVEDDLLVVSEVFYQGKRYIQQGTSFYVQDDNVYAGFDTATVTAITATSTAGVYSYVGAGTLTVGSQVQDAAFVEGIDSTAPGYVLTAASGSGTLYSPSAVLATKSSFVVYKPVVSTIKWAPITFGEENKLKRHKELEVLWGVREILGAELSTSSELVTTAESATYKFAAVLTSVGVNGFAPYNMRATVPQQHRLGQQLSAQLIVRCANGAWTILGVGCDADVIGPRVSR